LFGHVATEHDTASPGLWLDGPMAVPEELPPQIARVEGAIEAVVSW